MWARGAGRCKGFGERTGGWQARSGLAGEQVAASLQSRAGTTAREQKPEGVAGHHARRGTHAAYVQADPCPHHPWRDIQGDSDRSDGKGEACAAAFLKQSQPLQLSTCRARGRVKRRSPGQPYAGSGPHPLTQQSHRRGSPLTCQPSVSEDRETGGSRPRPCHGSNWWCWATVGCALAWADTTPHHR